MDENRVDQFSVGHQKLFLYLLQKFLTPAIRETNRPLCVIQCLGLSCEGEDRVVLYLSETEKNK